MNTGTTTSCNTTTQCHACNCMDPVLLVGRTAQVLSTQREEGHTKAPLREGRVHTDHLTNWLQHLPILTSSRSIISEKNDPIYLKSLKKKKKNLHSTFSLFQPQ